MRSPYLYLPRSIKNLELRYTIYIWLDLLMMPPNYTTVIYRVVIAIYVHSIPGY